MPARRNASPAWVHFPYKGGKYDFGTAELKRAWSRLHAGDAERWPDAKRVAALLAAPAARALVEADGGDAALAEGVQQAWRAFHRGDFRAAWETGLRLGPPGIVPAVKAAGVYARSLEKDAARAEALLLESADAAARAADAVPDYANAHYVHAFVLGRYSQAVSVMQALAAGYAPTIRRRLERVLELEPKHADAHLALAVWNAEIVARVGALGARLTYGATADAAARHFGKALALDPDAPVGRIEYANALVAMHGAKARAHATELAAQAAGVEPRDAMERLDVERAKAFEPR